FLSVGIFGLATIAFGLSKSFWLSLGVLVVLGAADMVSMVIRGAEYHQHAEGQPERFRQAEGDGCQAED
ncbi:hypothetical protein ACV334_33830, partial [Pseudomonas aeruginosa]